MSHPECHASSRLTDTQVLRLMHGMAPKKPTRSPDPQEALALMREGRVRGHGRRSPIVIWMQKNRAALEQGFAETTPSWDKLATYLGDHGVLDGNGKWPTAEATRQAWYRTRNMAPAKVRTANPAPATPAIVPVPATRTAPGIEAAPTMPPVPGDVEGTPARRTFGYATPRGLDPVAKAPAPPSPPPVNAETPTPAEPTINADDVLARFAPGATRR